MPSAHRNGTCPSGDVTLFYRRFGAASDARTRTPVLIVHGLSFFSYDWIGVSSELAGEREVVAMDMRGFGDSTWSPSRDYAVPTMAGDLVALLDHLGWPRAILVGHSMGGRNCAYCAAKNPARVAGLVLVDYSPENAPAGSKRVTDVVAGQPDVFASIDEAMRYFGVPKDSPRRVRFEAYLRPVPGGVQVKRDLHFRDQFRRVKETGERPKQGVDMWQTLGELACPTLVVRGAQSDMFAPETVAKVKAANPRIDLVEVDGGHNVAGDNPQGFLAAIRPFLARLEVSS
ncbi:MAG TPA: alpha/beta hydrolase [Burkholderiales bacterium]|nr:alpha/beta hydrolase [Burkholderiales bacterium]